MNKFKNIFYIMATLVAITTFFGCKSDKEDEPQSGNIIGTWEYPSGSRESIVEYSDYSLMQFKADGTLIEVEKWEDGITVDYLTWTKEGNTLIISNPYLGNLGYTIIALTDTKLTISLFGITATYKKVPDSVIDDYL